MGVAADMWSSLTRGPRPVMRANLARGVPEARALAFLMIGCALVFVAQWPRLARRAQETGTEMAQLAAYEILAWLVVWPLVLYGLAALAHGASRALGGQGNAAGARIALFWSWLAAAPLALLAGLVAGLAGPGMAADLAGVLWLGAFALLWARSQREVAGGPRAHAA